MTLGGERSIQLSYGDMPAAADTDNDIIVPVSLFPVNEEKPKGEMGVKKKNAKKCANMDVLS